MQNEFNGKPIEYGRRFMTFPELTLVIQINFPWSYNFYMESENYLGKLATPIAVWRIKSPKN